jgi:hypothetical protein
LIGSDSSPRCRRRKAKRDPWHFSEDAALKPMKESSAELIEGSALDNVRRYIRILVDIGRLAGEKADLIAF